ncbi:MAG TPA: hypothetical protein VKR52_08305 [Terracidiphilus sp.]|nr:hypothetical protein [Terracidiphilus sp.]
MRVSKLLIPFLATVGVLSAGCHKNAVDPGAFKTALNRYYAGKQDCVWPDPVKFPAQADTSNDEQTKGFDALTDAGMLTRKTAEKSRFLIGSKQVNDYDLSQQGRSTWVANETQPGYGNFCFGSFTVSSVDNYAPANSDAEQYSVTYHYGLSGIPGWANSVEMKTAFPKIATDSSGQHMATAQLTKGENGWVVQNVQPAAPGT